MSELKSIRERRGITYEQVAEKAGISKEYYWMIENGKRDGFSYELAKKNCICF
ncbi:helix-turn-helix domain-containing protein [Listeria fleischmannii]|uniref:Transcriptional regulator n=1 Tax=Listeria fleischmannii FSL S10-1203 TaxID=1265822 RepID=W7DQC9_9LIST|nr:helix-turn-helix transcriptional regulator [Listeria fleischmannii]EUJ59494.1 transcriptional regulator [Listeria fleischmannii FSL S10-1203]